MIDFFLFVCKACQKIVQQRLNPLAAPSAGVGSIPRPTTPNHYSLGRHFGQSGTNATTPAGAVPPGYPGATSGFSSSSLSSVVAGSTLGPAGAGSIGTGHSSLAGYSSNGSGSALSGSALNLHSSTSASNHNTNGALAARGMKSLHVIYHAKMVRTPAGGSRVHRLHSNNNDRSVVQLIPNQTDLKRCKFYELLFLKCKIFPSFFYIFLNDH